MEKQDLYRLSPEDELMMAGASMEVRRALSNESIASSQSPPSTPDKSSIKDQNFKKLDMPKPFKL